MKRPSDEVEGIGQLVELQGLKSRPELNGQRGVVIGEKVAATGRVAVAISGGEGILLKLENLRVVAFEQECPAMRRIDVAIVGAGLSGLASAMALVKAGRQVIVLDARTQVGGRTLSHLGVDMGASWAWPPHEARATALAAKLGIKLLPQRLDGNAFAFHQGSMRSVGGMGEQMAPCGGGAVRFRGGYANLAAAAANSLPAGTIRLEMAVTKVEALVAADAAGEQGLVRVTCSNQADNNATTEIIARRVVMALPPGVMSRSISMSPALPAEQQKKQAKTLTWCGDWAKVAAHFTSPFWRAAGHSGVVATSGPIQVWWEGGGGEELGEESYALVGLGVGEDTRELASFERAKAAHTEGSAAHDADDEAGSNDEAGLRELVIRALSPAFGDVVAEQLSHVSSKAWIADELTYNGMGTHRDYGHPLLRQPTPWGVHFAGTETEAANGHVEGAIAAGERAAEEVLAALRSREQHS